MKMDNYVTGAVIKALREKQNMTQEELAQKICVTGKAVSKWETGRGFPDIGLLENLGKALGVSVIELLSGESITNRNKACNMARGNFYVCPVCGNIIHTTGEAVISCCGITLPALEPEILEAENPEAETIEAAEGHAIRIERIEDEYFVSLNHPMTKDHYISFLAALSDQGLQLVKLYPEGPAQARFKIAGVRRIYAFCRLHGLFSVKVR
jgi:transcriptional regulator with XRE-family HTH domain